MVFNNQPTGRLLAIMIYITSPAHWMMPQQWSVPANGAPFESAMVDVSSRSTNNRIALLAGRCVVKANDV